MALQPRHRWMVQRAVDFFGFPVPAVENAFRDEANYKVLARFLAGTQSHVFVCSAPTPPAASARPSTRLPSASPSVALLGGGLAGVAAAAALAAANSGSNAAGSSAAAAGNVSVAAGSDPDSLTIVLTDGTEDIGGRSVLYFVRHAKFRGELDLSTDSDGAILFGTMSPSVLESLEALMRHLYKPLLENLDSWGSCTKKDAQAFVAAVDGYADTLAEALTALSTGLELRRPDPRFDLDAARTRAAPSMEMLVHFVELLEDWCRQTEAYLDDSDQVRLDVIDAGPKTELEYWRRRMQRLTSITEQLKTKECQTVIAVLGSVTKSHQDFGVDRSTVTALMRRWRQIDASITEAANEAKDNVKFLHTLEKFIEPLYSATPGAIIDTLPALMNAIKMIHTIARYYNTTERMTNLFMKITNQMIVTCRRCVEACPAATSEDSLIMVEPVDDILLAVGAPTTPTPTPAKVARTTGRVESANSLWTKAPGALLQALEACLRLNEAYQEQYRLTKDKLLTVPKGPQFDFSEHQIFGKFDLFCRRVIKLLDMFSTIHQFNTLARHHLEGMADLTSAFFTVTKEFRSKGHDLLEFTNSKFDRDYVEFNVRISDLETALQHFINNSFESITSIEQSLALLKKFQTILQRDNLKNDLESKLILIFHSYGLDLMAVQDLYEHEKHQPPVPRNLPPVAGNIMWARHLLNRIQVPMREFESNSKLMNMRDSRKIIKTYNRVAKTLIAFEYLWYEAWCKTIADAKSGLSATLIVRHSLNNKLYVNFDPDVVQLIREAKCLYRLGIDIPEDAKLVMLQEEKFKMYYNELSYLLREYDRIVASVLPITATVLEPHIRDLDVKMRPGMVALTWASMNIDAYRHGVAAALVRFESLLNKINDIVENRIDKNIKLVTKAQLVDLPRDRSLSLDEFVEIEERHIKDLTVMIAAKNMEIESAVDDLLTLVVAYPLDAGVGAVDTNIVKQLKEHYNGLMYQALLRATKSSLIALKRRVCSKSSIGFLFLERPFFEVDVQLAVPSVRLSPGLDDIQRTINKVALAVLRCSKSVWDWDQSHLPENQRLTFHARIGLDIEIVKVVLLLTGAFQGTRQQVADYLSTFQRYDWLWKEDMEAAYKRFMTQDPQIEDFDAELRKFVAVEKEIESITPLHNIGALSLNSKNLKLQLRHECRSWKLQYSDKVHQQARDLMFGLHEYIQSSTTKLKRQVDSLDTLRFVMGVLRAVRERDASIEMDISPILDMYQMLENYLPGGVVDKEEMDQRSILRTQWTRLMEFAEQVTDRLSEVQGTFKRQLTRDVRDFQMDVHRFRNNFDATGPMVPGLTPQEAVERLNRFRSELTDLDRKREIFEAGEELFALRKTPYPDLVRTTKEIQLLDQLYSLYLDVVKCVDAFKALTWARAVEELASTADRVAAFDTRCKRLPKRLREWDAYQELRTQISSLQDILPLLQALSRDCMKPRHWQQVMDVTGHQFSIDGELFKLRTLLDAKLLDHREAIEEICDGAEKQAAIEARLVDIKLMWSMAEFQFGKWRNRDTPILVAYGAIMEQLEESQLALQTMLSVRHVAPFQEETQSRLTLLSNTADTLELWVKVQMLWMNLESVFTGGDIAKQMPLEAKKFVRIDKDWNKIMLKAQETSNVVACCANEVLCNMLPGLLVELEKCQKSLEGYLEQKRGKFPRFYFVSNPVLLQILSQGSDPLAVQIFYEKIFDSIDHVVHDPSDVRKITHFQSTVGSEQEQLAFRPIVPTEGNIEQWLGVMETAMQATMKRLAEAVAGDCMLVSVGELLNNHCAQMALLGLQFAWTAACSAALEKAKSSKTIMAETQKRQVAVLADLSELCLKDLGSSMARIKVETLVTIQVHQRDVFTDLLRLWKERKLTDANDFEWLKQARFMWRPQDTDKHGEGAVVVAICDVEFKYAYEYLGCKERLVITTLTDRAYITLSQALGMNLGGAPAGPAGTGKTETVKDLGRALGLYVVVTNCTDQQRYTDMAKIFKGLCQAGLWGCFDEFNRIELPVLSVVAQQVLAITNAKRVGADSFTFPGDAQPIRLVSSVGYFITMNPGYQGRQELPENLKALFRGVAMMVPDREIIMKVKLCSVGYSSFAELAVKFRTLYALCEEQLSKQKHYDFGLRNILSVLRTAGKTKRDSPTVDEEVLMMRTLRDMNLSKMVAQDIPLFLALLKDLFPTVGAPPGREFPAVTSAISKCLVERRLVQHDTWVNKIMQLYETTLVRHGIMLVGPAGSGKSTMFNVLAESLGTVTGIAHKQARMNPKAIRAEEMFGETDRLSGEWITGIFAAMWEKYNRRDLSYNMWIVCDGPVDAIWIENLNTVLDDNKILTLANGDRLPMTDNVKLMFEVEDLRNASPATVSRAGIIYVSATDLDWSPIVTAWLANLPPLQAEVFRTCFSKYVMGDDKPTALAPVPVGALFVLLQKTCRPVVPCTRVGIIAGCLNLLTYLLRVTGFAEAHTGTDDITAELQNIFIFSLAWSAGGLLEAEHRAILDNWLRKQGAPMPPQAHAEDTVFDYCVDHYSQLWKAWELPEWEFPSQPAPDAIGPGGVIGAFDISRLLVPTVDSTRSVYLLSALHAVGRPVMMIGSQGTAKTSSALIFFENLKAADASLLKVVNFSSATTGGMFQAAVEGELDRRGGKSFGPPGGKKLTLFLDDVSMPACNAWGDQPTLELVRQLLETGGFAFLDKDKRGEFKSLEDLQYVAAMSQPGSGKNDIPARLKRHFFLFNMVVPSRMTLNGIFGRLLKGRFSGPLCPKPVTAVSEKLMEASMQLWTWCKKTLLPTPAKFHYNFTLRDLSRVFQGVMRVPLNRITADKVLIQLWRHECDRVFADKLASDEDKAKFAASADEICRKVLGSAPPELLFVDFLHMDDCDDDGVAYDPPRKVYEPSAGLEALRQLVTDKLATYNEEKPAMAMQLVLFDDAMRHLLRIARLLSMPRGNALLVGVGGSGKQSLTRLAAYIVGHTTFQIQLTKSYNAASLMDNLRQLYKQTGQAGQCVTFLITDAEIKDETFLEYFNSILMTGEVPGLFPKDEMAIMCGELAPIAIKERPGFQETPDNLVRFFVDRVRSNLHLVLCMSPVNPKFPERARKFPGLVNGCSIDWFLPWPEQALVAVSKGVIGQFELEAEPAVRESLIVHMGMVHKLAVETCNTYQQRMRRYVYQTPKSFLSFLSAFKGLYVRKLDDIKIKEQRIHLGLAKLKQGAADVAVMKVNLANEEVKLREADAACSAMLKSLEVSSLEAKREKEAVNKIKEACEIDAQRIALEKKDAEEDLAKAQPFLDEANNAIDSINAGDLTELKGLAKPSDIIKLVFDCVLMLQMQPVHRVSKGEMVLGIGKGKRTVEFVADSYALAKKGILSDVNFLKSLLYFSEHEKDKINEETIELLAPYMELEDFTPEVARNASKAAEGLCTWARAMTLYHQASKVVKPKLEALNMAESRLEEAEAELDKASTKLARCKAVLDKLQADFEAQMADKSRIEENASRTRQRMEQATALINGLSGERQRWSDDSKEFADKKRRLVGDVALACAFVSYAGPFNQDFRDILVREQFKEDLNRRSVPVTSSLDLTQFLVDQVTISDWVSEGLPTDPLSIQNGIMVTRSSRFPLLVDPQGQGLKWIVARETRRLLSSESSTTAEFRPITLQHPRLREQLEFALQEGFPLVIYGIEQEVDPMLDPVLEKQYVVRNKSKYITIGDRVVKYDDNFMLYLMTRLPNPHFSPELQAKTTVVDFAVTQKGLEEQLLGMVIQKEQKSLEDQLNEVLNQVHVNTKALVTLDALLLERLTANQGNLLDDSELIGVLASTKAKATEVNHKLAAAAETRQSINEKREQFRPVATRGSVLYFAIVDMSLVNCMYQTSLDQFLALFLKSMEVAEKSNLASHRIQNIVSSMTSIVVAYIARGLYEVDKLSFKLIVLFKTMITAGLLPVSEMKLFLKAGAAMDIRTARPKTARWMSDQSWLNILALAEGCQVLKNVPDLITMNDSAWRRWYEDNEPEKQSLLELESRLNDMGEMGNFYRLLLVRCLREDRTLLAAFDFIRSTEWIVPTSSAEGAATNKLPALGPEYIAPSSTTLDALYAEMNAATPVIYLLSAGADPTDAVETFARKMKQTVACVSMGEGQDAVAARAIQAACAGGSWVLLQNCHLGLPFMESLEGLLKKLADATSPEFRLFISCEPHKSFPIALLQMCTKVTNEPPAGLRAGLLRSYTAIVDQGMLERVDTPVWRQLVYVVCFLHSIVQERRKFGPLGWNIPYEFNSPDLQASLMFLEKHLYHGSVSWPTVQYMIAEVQYGGKITDNLDRRLFSAFSEAWVSQAALAPTFSFNPANPIARIPSDFVYNVPDTPEVEAYRKVVRTFPEVDSPEVFGLHPNADLTFRVKEATSLLTILKETQPKDSNVSGGQTREDVVDAKAEELLAKLPAAYEEDDVTTRIGRAGGMHVPLNIFLYQEIQRLDRVLGTVRVTLQLLRQAIHGEVIMTPELFQALGALFDARVPPQWVFTVGGDELSWLSPTIGLWFASLIRRDEQLRGWLNNGRPNSFWMTGFFNPQGFLTAMRQEVTRSHQKDQWALDDVVYHAEVMELDSPETLRSAPREGVFVHGLFMEGAAWSKSAASLVESEPKRLYAPLPILFVTAVTTSQQKTKRADCGPYGGYDCPVYKYPCRTDRFLIFYVHLPSREHRPSHWVLRGVALLCSTD